MESKKKWDDVYEVHIVSYYQYSHFSSGEKEAHFPFYRAQVLMHGAKMDSRRASKSLSWGPNYATRGFNILFHIAGVSKLQLPGQIQPTASFFK
jgi:hypothetical protein